jgi:large subunit ribosomal protein L13
MTLNKGHHVTRTADQKPGWHHKDAQGKTLGRLSTEIAILLTGKNKPTYASHILTGDYVVVTNAEKIHVTGDKLKQKIYYRHSGYHGGLTERTLAQLLEKTPERVITQAVKGMLPRNKLGKKMLSRLKVYAGPDHPHQAQFGPAGESQKEEEP